MSYFTYSKTIFLNTWIHIILHVKLTQCLKNHDICHSLHKTKKLLNFDLCHTLYTFEIVSERPHSCQSLYQTKKAS